MCSRGWIRKGTEGQFPVLQLDLPTSISRFPPKQHQHYLFLGLLLQQMVPTLSRWWQGRGRAWDYCKYINPFAPQTQSEQITCSALLRTTIFQMNKDVEMNKTQIHFKGLLNSQELWASMYTNPKSLASSACNNRYSCNSFCSTNCYGLKIAPLKISSGYF